MELPHIGEHCSETTCRQLDFLPFTCSFCKKIYCLEHHKASAHHCPEAKNVDAQVPVCPLCNKAVPAPRGTIPDIAISQHLDNNCVVKKKKIYNNSCSYSKCRKKELMPVVCPDCGLNYCIPHRHPNDHSCPRVDLTKQTLPAPSNGSFLQSLRDSATARLSRVTTASSSHERSTSDIVSQFQAEMTEDEALALAIAQSEQAEMEKNWRRSVADGSRQTPQPVNSSNKDSCSLS